MTVADLLIMWLSHGGKVREKESEKKVLLAKKIS
jgi:hypothetical protein